MHTTEDYEHLLELDEVIGVEFDDENHEVQVLVREKLPEDELEEDQIVANNVSESSDVLPIGEVHLEVVRQNLDYRKRQRPVHGSLSEGPDTSYSAGTGGPLARVTTPDSEHWDDDVEEGDLVRVSNNHVYAGSAHVAGHFEAEIYQPGQLDQGGPSDRVGSLVGYVPFEDGIRVDCAARTVEADEALAHVGFEGEVNDVQQEDYGSLKGESVAKSGRTTGLTEAEIIATSATIRVQMSEDGDVVTFRDQLVANDMSDGGDSGSAVFGPDGELVGLLFAGSPSATIINKIGNVEDELGVEFAPDLEESGADGSEDDTPSRVLSVEPIENSPLSFPFSFRVSDDSDVEILGGTNSTEIVGNTVNGYVQTWANVYEITGEVVSHGITDAARVTLDGEEIDPDDLPDIVDQQ